MENKKIIGVMQPYFMPYLGYFQHIASVDCFVLYDDVNFIKRGWINRNRIINNGKEYLFSLPLSKLSQNRLICEHEFVDNSSKIKLWNIVKCSYRKSREWEKVKSLLENVIMNPALDLVDYIFNSINKVCKYLDINTEIIKSSKLNNDKSLKAQDKIMDICKLLGGKTYINPSGGVELYDDQLFSINEIDLKFIFPNLKEYDQSTNVFIAGLSIIDVLCNVPKIEIKAMLKEYSLKSKSEL